MNTNQKMEVTQQCSSTCRKYNSPTNIGLTRPALEKNSVVLVAKQHRMNKWTLSLKREET